MQKGYIPNARCMAMHRNPPEEGKKEIKDEKNARGNKKRNMIHISCPPPFFFLETKRVERF
jgi:hypothetical protein